MPASLVDLYYARRNDSRLKKQVESAIFKAAYAVITEDANYPNHALRLTWAKGVRFSSSNLTASVEQAVMIGLDNQTIAAKPDDADDNDVQFVVNSIVDVLAGAVGA